MAGKCHTALSPPTSPSPFTAAGWNPARLGPSAGWLDSTVQGPGTVTWKVNAAFRSGCSKFA